MTARTKAKAIVSGLAAALALAGAGCVGPIAPVPHVPFPSSTNQAVNEAVPDSALIADVPPDPNSAPQVATFGTDVSLGVGDAAQFDDGVVVRIDRIEGAHCAPGEKCTGPDASSVTLRINGGDFGFLTKVIALDTAQSPEQDLLNYRFSLRGAKDDTVRIVVDKL